MTRINEWVNKVSNSFSKGKQLNEEWAVYSERTNTVLIFKTTLKRYGKRVLVFEWYFHIKIMTKENKTRENIMNYEKYHKTIYDKWMYKIMDSI